MSDFAKVEQSFERDDASAVHSFSADMQLVRLAMSALLLPDGNLLAAPTGSCLGNLNPQRLSGNPPRMANG
ncbi:hypothetical protein ACNKHM_19270 [Shigella sonnei]